MSEVQRHCKWHGPFQSVQDSMCPSCLAHWRALERVEPTVPTVTPGMMWRLYAKGECVFERTVTDGDVDRLQAWMMP